MRDIHEALFVPQACKWPFILRWRIHCNETCFILFFGVKVVGNFHSFSTIVFYTRSGDCWRRISVAACFQSLSLVRACCHDFECTILFFRREFSTMCIGLASHILCCEICAECWRMWSCSGFLLNLYGSAFRIMTVIKIVRILIRKLHCALFGAALKIVQQLLLFFLLVC